MPSPVEIQPGTIPFEDLVAATLATQDCFVADKPLWVARAPGRLDVMGGNVDYTGGLVLQSLLREAVWVAVQPRSDNVIRILNPGATRFGWEPCLELSSDELGEAESIRLLFGKRESSRWGCYVLGALHFLTRCYGWDSDGGANLFIDSNLPPNKGVSSSAALVVATIKAVSAARGLSIEGISLATAAQWVENVVVGSACGIMDQAAIVLGRQNLLLPMLCQPCQPFPAVTLPVGLSLWGIDSMVSRSTTGVAYETARAAAFIGYKLICQREKIDVIAEEISGISRFTDSRWGGYLSNLTPAEFRASYERWLPESLTGHEFIERAGEHVDPFTTIDLHREYPVRSAARYAVEEHFRVQMLCTLLEAATQDASKLSLRLIGEILCQSHVAYSDCGLGSDACDELVSRALEAGFLGAKMTGGGAGGVVAILGRSSDRRAIHTVAERYGDGRAGTPYIFEGSSSGVDAFGVRTMQLSTVKGTQY
jgi:galactokinase